MNKKKALKNVLLTKVNIHEFINGPKNVFKGSFIIIRLYCF